MKPKLVITDIDATLTVKHQTLTPRAKKAIQVMQEHGIYFGIASGRPLEQIYPSLEEWGIEAQVILGFNGCHLQNNVQNTFHEYFPMKAEWMRETFDLMAPFEVVPNIFANKTNYFGPGLGVDFPPNWDVVIKEDPSFFWQENPKIMWRLKHPEQMEEIEDYLSKHPSPYYKGFKTGPMLIEFANKNVSKGYALKEFCKQVNIDIKDVIALGDTSNDNELLQVAGCGVCMLNGTDDTKAIADMITDVACDDDGWADFIEKNVLIPNGWM